jgi:hypothetical protein
MKKLIFLVAAVVFANILSAQQTRPKSTVNFCHNSKPEIYLDSLGKCAELLANDATIKIMSYTVNFESANGQMKKFSILGSVFTPELIKELNENRKYINLITINGILAEKDKQFIKLPEAQFMFFF